MAYHESNGKGDQAKMKINYSYIQLCWWIIGFFTIPLRTFYIALNNMNPLDTLFFEAWLAIWFSIEIIILGGHVVKNMKGETQK